jgi:hypothetical protein
VGQAEIDRQQHHADPAGRQAELDEGQAVAHQQRQHLAAGQPLILQRRSKARHPRIQRLITDGVRVVDDGDLLRRIKRMPRDRGPEVDHDEPPTNWNADSHNLERLFILCARKFASGDCATHTRGCEVIAAPAVLAGCQAHPQPISADSGGDK